MTDHPPAHLGEPPERGPDPAEPPAGAAGSGPDWPPLVGGEAGLRRLEAALAAPTHAYLLVGAVAGDKRAVARTFAGELLAAAADDAAESHRRRAVDGTHPDVVLVAPEGRELLAAEARAIVSEAGRRSLEGAGKVIVCDRFHTAAPEVAASLLKTIEEPPPETTVVLLADDVPPSHATVESRCVTVRFPSPSPEQVREWLVRSGVPLEGARRAAHALGAEPGLAADRVAAGDLAARIDAWWTIPDRLDGTGARAAALVDELRAMIDTAVAAAASPEAPSGPARGAAGAGGSGAEQPGAARSEGQRRDRRLRRVRDAELRFGFAVLAQRYRDALEGPAGAEAAEAIDRLRAAAAALVRNPDEKLLLQNLLLHLPQLQN